MDDAPNFGQADAGSFKPSRPVESLKHTKEFVCALQVEANPIVANETNRFAFAVLGSDFDLCLGARASVFDCVGKQIDDDLAQHERIAQHFGQVPDPPVNLAPFDFNAQFPSHIPHERGEAHPLEAHFHVAQSGKLQQGGNHFPHMRRRLRDRLEMLAADFDERDPAVEALISLAIAACKKQGKYVGICGQGPSDHPDFARWLAAEGISSLSLNPDSVISTWQQLAKP